MGLLTDEVVNPKEKVIPVIRPGKRIGSVFRIVQVGIDSTSEVAAPVYGAVLTDSLIEGLTSISLPSTPSASGSFQVDVVKQQVSDLTVTEPMDSVMALLAVLST